MSKDQTPKSALGFRKPYRSPPPTPVPATPQQLAKLADKFKKQ